MAGKTGTAQKLGSGRAKDRDQYVSSFVGFAPMPKPQYVVLVMVDDPREGHYGAQVAGPAYRRIIEAMLDQGLLEADPERYNAADEPEPERDPEPKRPQAD
jgi:cell division protein FtsI/penicillin-binding protein 2